MSISRRSAPEGMGCGSPSFLVRGAGTNGRGVWRAALDDGAQAVVVIATGRIKERAQVELARRQHTALHEQQRDEQSSDAAVTNEERVDRLELFKQGRGRMVFLLVCDAHVRHFREAL